MEITIGIGGMEFGSGITSFFLVFFFSILSHTFEHFSPQLNNSSLTMGSGQILQNAHLTLIRDHSQSMTATKRARGGGKCWQSPTKAGGEHCRKTSSP